MSVASCFRAYKGEASESDVDLLNEFLEGRPLYSLSKSDGIGVISSMRDVLKGNYKTLTGEEYTDVASTTSPKKTGQSKKSKAKKQTDKLHVSVEQLLEMGESDRVDTILDGKDPEYQVGEEVLEDYNIAMEAQVANASPTIQALKELPAYEQGKAKGAMMQFGMTSPEFEWIVANPEMIQKVEERDGENDLSYAENFTAVMEENQVREPEWSPSNTLTAQVDPYLKETDSIDNDIVEGFKTTKDAIQWLSKNATNPVVRTIAKLINPVVGRGVPFSVVEGLTNRDGKKISGLYSPEEGSNSIKVDSVTGTNEQTILHELIHAATFKVLDANESTLTKRQLQGKRDLEKLLKTINEGDYFSSGMSEKFKVFEGVNGLDELITYGLTDSIAQKWMNNTQYEGAKNVWTKFIDSIAKMLGVRKGSMLEEIVRIAEEITADPQTGIERNGLTSPLEAADNTRTPIDLIGLEAGTDSVAADVSGTADPDYMAQAAKAETGRITRIADTVMGSVSDNWQTAKMANIPQQHLIVKAELEGLKSAASLLDVQEKINIMTNTKKDRDEREVLEPARLLANKNKPDYDKVVRMMHNATRDNKSPTKTAEFLNLDPAAQAVYHRTEAYFKDQALDTIESLEVSMENLGISKEVQRNYSKELEIMRNKLGSTIYFPMQRFGDWKLDMVNADGMRYVSHNDKKADAIAEQAIKEAEGFTLTSLDKVPELNYNDAGLMDEQAFTKVRAVIEGVTNPNGEAAEVAKEALYKAFTQLSALTTLEKRTQKRKFVAGASTDLVRGINSTLAIHKENAKRLYAGERAMNMQAVEDEYKVLAEGGEKLNTVEPIMRELRLREKMTTEAKKRATWSTAASKWNFILSLGFQPAAALVNTTQNVIVGVPVLGSKYGGVNAAKEITKAFGQTSKNLNKLDKVLEGEELMAYQHLRRTGVIDDTQANMMTGLHDGASENYSGYGDTFDKYAALMFSQAEIANRIAISMAAFRLARTGTDTVEALDYAGAIEYARTATTEVHFNYSEEGKGRMARTDIGGVLLAFKSYPIQMTSFMSHNFKAGFVYKNMSAVEKQEARYKLFGMLAATFTLGGSLGMPLAQVVGVLFDFVLDDEDDPYEAVRIWAEKGVGTKGADVLLNGLVGGLADTDLTSRVGLTGMFMRFPKGDLGLDEWGKEGFKALVGPVGGKVLGVGKASEAFSDGNFLQGTEKLMPTAITNMSKAVRWGMDGSARDYKDRMQEVDFDVIDAFRKGMGFNSLEYKKTTDKYWADKNANFRSKESKRDLTRDLTMAQINGSGRDVREARAAIRNWNTDNPGNKITQSTIKRSIRAMKKKLTGEE